MQALRRVAEEERLANSDTAAVRCLLRKLEEKLCSNGNDASGGSDPAGSGGAASVAEPSADAPVDGHDTSAAGDSWRGQSLRTEAVAAA